MYGWMDVPDQQLKITLYVCIRMYVCMYVSDQQLKITLYVCMYVCMYMYMYIHTCIYIYEREYYIKTSWEMQANKKIHRKEKATQTQN